ncbi:MAG: GH1 family beta-glucosidase [Deinococcota bacterium]
MNFPETFEWGTATAAYQIEGAATEDGRGASIWDTFSATPGKVFQGHTGAVACDHYHRWQTDLDLLSDLGVTAYRFSTAWPRILPRGYGTVNSKGLDFYDQLIDGLLARNIKPFVTLYHWDLPQVLEDRGGWRNPDISEIFCEYAHAVAERLAGRAFAYATMNEPWCIASLGHELGEHAPGLQDRQAALTAAHNVLLAHGKALPVLREHAPSSQLGIVLNLMPSYPASDSDDDIAAARAFDGWFNRWYLDPLLTGEYPQDAWQSYGNDVPDVASQDAAIISKPLDFLGVNYYTRALVRYNPQAAFPFAHALAPDDPARDPADYTDMGWEVYPDGLYDLLTDLAKRDNLPPLYITENGAAYPDELRADAVEDSARVAYYDQHLAALANALADGVDVRGYFAWSLMDNFEWAHGYSKRFGLYYVDYDTQVRLPKDSATWYQALIRARS